MADAYGSVTFDKGIEALRNDHLYLARACFEQAMNEERSACNCSFLALPRARPGGGLKEATALALEAVAREPGNSLYYLNLGRIYLANAQRAKAIEAFRKGLQYSFNAEIVAELERLGTRKPPLFPSLGRHHPLNRYLGLFLARLHLR
jgi:tetratricopeptide (TPR) repeat protein